MSEDPWQYSLAELIDRLTADLAKALQDAATRASELRAQVRESAPATATVSPEELHEHLLACRAATDGLEDLMANLTRLRARADQALADRQAEVEDAEVEVARQKTELGPEYSSGRERAVNLNMMTIDQRIAVRRAERLQRDVASVLEYVRIKWRGADGTRRDTETRLRAVTLTTSLERG
jgi:hypothetical protein